MEIRIDGTPTEIRTHKVRTNDRRCYHFTKRDTIVLDAYIDDGIGSSRRGIEDGDQWGSYRCGKEEAALFRVSITCQK